MIDSGIGKYLLFTLLGMFLMWVVLKMLSQKTSGNSGTTAAFVDLAKTGQAMNLVRTNEFREIVKTPEFRNFVKTLAEEQVKAMSIALI